MNELKRRHPWMSDELIRTIGRAALARAAQQFAGAEMWADAADCHARLGQHAQAAEMFVRAGDLRAAAAACLDGDAFAQALAHYQTWTAQQRPDDMAAQVEGLLGQSACHRLPPLLELDAPGLDAENGRLLYLQARELTEQATPPLVVGAGVLLATIWFTSPPFVAVGWILVFAVLGAALMGTLGLIAGLWAEKFDQIAAFQNFLIMPATFLAGVFYSVHSLPPFWQSVSHLNPFFYMVDGFRYGFFGVSDASPWLSLGIVGAAWVGVSLLAVHLLRTGYKIRN